MPVEGEMGLFDEAAAERTQTEERKPFLFFPPSSSSFLPRCVGGDGTDTLKVEGSYRAVQT